MTANDAGLRTPLRAIGLCLGVALSFGLGLPVASPAVAAPAKPQLNIAIDDGQTSAKNGDALGYTITIRNTGAAVAHRLAVTQTLPQGLSFKSADAAGVVKTGAVHWTVTVKPGGKAVMHTAMTVTATPKGTLRLATVACASTSAKGPPLVCASHSDQLPAGAAAAAHQKPASSSGASSSNSHVWWFVGGAAVVVLLVGLSRLRRRRRA
jgi:uncharacterized repeat protein (TIGR01451 family)